MVNRFAMRSLASETFKEDCLFLILANARLRRSTGFIMFFRQHEIFVFLDLKTELHFVSQGVSLQCVFEECANKYVSLQNSLDSNIVNRMFTVNRQ